MDPYISEITDHRSGIRIDAVTYVAALQSGSYLTVKVYKA